MTEQQLHKPTLTSRDLIDSNYKEALTSKVDELLKESDIKKVTTIKKKSIDRVVTDTALRRKKDKGRTFDDRSKSPNKYKEKGLLKGTKGTLEENLMTDLDYHKRCHDEQYKLFDELSKRFPETGFLTNAEQRKDEKGRWFLYRGNKKFTTTKFLNFIDKITLEYIKQLSDIKEKKSDIQTIADSCQTIVMVRYLDNINSDTDFMKDKETKLWRNHVAVILSFAALLVILEMMKLKLNQRKSNERTNERTIEKNRNERAIENNRNERTIENNRNERTELVSGYTVCFYLNSLLVISVSFWCLKIKHCNGNVVKLKV